MSDDGGPGDPYSRVAYRRVIAWEARIEREGPLLRRALAAAPDDTVLDLGCGTGEHVRFFATLGARAVGLDRSPSMIEAAREHGEDDRCRFVLGDALEAERLLADEPPFGLAICLGNMLPHLVEREALDAFARAAAALLRPKGVLLLQILNYARILDQGVRHLPVNVRPGEDGREIVFLRLLKPAAKGRLLFFPTTLELDPEAEEPVRVQASKRVPLRAWRDMDVREALDRAGFAVSLLGDMEGGPYDAAASTDLVVWARRKSV